MGAYLETLDKVELMEALRIIQHIGIDYLKEGDFRPEVQVPGSETEVHIV